MILVLQIVTGMVVGQAVWATIMYLVQLHFVKKRRQLEVDAMQMLTALREKHKEEKEKPNGGQYL